MFSQNVDGQVRYDEFRGSIIHLKTVLPTYVYTIMLAFVSSLTCSYSFYLFSHNSKLNKKSSTSRKTQFMWIHLYTRASDREI